MKAFVPTMLAMMLGSAPALAEPFAYSVNSDGPDQATSDSLFRIDLATGAATAIGKVRPFDNQINSDIEGLAFSPGMVLYGADDADETLLTIHTGTGQGTPVNGSPFNLGLTAGNYDFGLSFDCNGQLLLVADNQRSLYQVDAPSGAAQLVGGNGALTNPITGIAVRGKQVFGIGQGADDAGNPLAPNLYLIDPHTGATSLVGPLGPAVAPYRDAGLDFDADGNLWALTDRRDISGGDQPSQVLSIDPLTGTASVVSEVDASNGAVGFEGLAIAGPAQCSNVGPAIPQEPAMATWATGIPTLDLRGLLLMGLLVGGIGALAIRRLA